jgi:hypothetical protein
MVLREHPDVLSISELFAMLKGTLRSTEVPSQEMDGAQLWRILTARDPFADARIRDGLTTPEMTYPYGSGRFDPVTGVPLICHNMLPMLAGDPDALFGLLAAEVPRWPARPAAEQYRALFGFLAGLLGRPVIVERSGASLTLVRTLRRQFPEARFVHMHRDGPACAISMSRHPVFRLAGLTAEAARAAGLPESLPWQETEARLQQLREDDRLPAGFAELIGWPFDAQRYMSYPVPVTFFGELWSWLVCQGAPALAELPAASWLSLRYEDLLAGPRAQLAMLADFIGIPPSEEWLAAAGQLISRPGGAAGPPPAPAELAALRAACEPGTHAIAAAARRPEPAGSRP